MLERYQCEGDLECFLTSLGNDPFMGEMVRGPLAAPFRKIYTSPENTEQKEASITTAMQLVESFNGFGLNWFNGSACAFEHLTPLFFRLWTGHVEFRSDEPSEWNNWFYPNGWGHRCHQVWEHEEFPAYLEDAGLIEYYRAKQWPDACRPDDQGDGFSCSKAIWDEKRAAAGF
jgi:hypothetical protein